MTMSKIETLATYKALEQSRNHRNADITEHLLEIHGGEKVGLKRIQFEAHPVLSDRLDSVCNMLDVSKREFLEAAVIDAIDRAQDGFGSIYRQATGREFGEDTPC